MCNSVLNAVFSISFKTEIQPLNTKTILHEISTAGTQTEMASLTLKRWMYFFWYKSTSILPRMTLLLLAAPLTIKFVEDSE